MVDELEVLLDDLRHILVLILDAPLHRTGAVPFVQHLGRMEHRLLPHLEAGGTVVTEDIMQLRLAHIAGHLGQVIEPFVALGVPRRLRRRQHGVELHRCQQGIDHGILPLAGVDVQAVDGDGGRSGVEVFILDLALLAAVHRVGIGRAKPFQVEPVSSCANLLIWRERDA